MEKILLGFILITALTGCGAEDETTEGTQDGKENPEIEITKNNWNQGDWNDIEWQ